LYLSDNKSRFYNHLDYLISKNEVNAVIGSLVSRSGIKYGINRPNPFCNDPLNYVSKTDLTKRYDFENTFVKAARRVLGGDSVAYKNQGHLTNGVQTAGNFFALKGDLIASISDIIHLEIEKYRRVFENSNEGFIECWPKSYKLEGWLVSMQSGGKLASHMHDTGWITGSVYINVPAKAGTDSGNLVVAITDAKDATGGIQSQSIDVTTGSLCLFPSSLLHHTVPFASNDVRIVLAFDVIPQ
jgi:hypothetical protein